MTDESVAGRVNTRYTQRMAELAVDILPRLRKEERTPFTEFLKAVESPDDPPATFVPEDDAARLDDRYAADLEEIGRLVAVR
ncbi:hypothetical protein [Brevibacterium litoralis]|uniref:hypothetical protein n=1 Tax=Brevibacterium litoralis TaxID=3138935 RepID=UPI0032EBE20C